MRTAPIDQDGRLQEALTESKTALDLDPLSPVAESGVARRLYDLRQTQDAIAHYNQALSLDPEAGGASQGLALALLAAGKYNEGVAEADKARRLMGGDAMITSDLGYAYALAGRNQEARQILDQLLHWSGREPLRALPSRTFTSAWAIRTMPWSGWARRSISRT